MPQSSHTSLPSSRWKESTVRVPLDRRAACCVISAALSIGFRGGGIVGVHFFQLGGGQVIADRVRQDEVAVGQALHQRAGAEAIGAVVGEIRFTDHEQAGDGAHQVVVHPEAAHRVVDGRIDAHRHLVRILAGDALVHFEQVAVALLGCRACRGAGWHRRNRDRRRGPSRRRRGLRRRRLWRCARRRRAAPGCRSWDSGAPGSNRARLRESGRGERLSPFFSGTQMRPSLRSDSLISVSFD